MNSRNGCVMMTASLTLPLSLSLANCIKKMFAREKTSPANYIIAGADILLRDRLNERSEIVHFKRIFLEDIL